MEMKHAVEVADPEAARRGRILIVDDDSGVRESYRDILSPEETQDFLSLGAVLFDGPPVGSSGRTGDYDLAFARRGEEGVDAVRRSVEEDRPFAVAFVDMKMPGIDGAETARRIWGEDARVKIIIVTAYSERSPDDIMQVTNREDIFYLRKPFNPDEIRQFARALTTQWFLEQERESLTARIRSANEELADVNRGLQRKVRQQAATLVQSEKMASIGILSAGVAHEINNPISYVNGNLVALKKYAAKILGLLSLYRQLEAHVAEEGPSKGRDLIAGIERYREDQKIDFVLEDIIGLADESLEGVDRVKTIVNDLKTFARIDEAEFKPIDVNETIDKTLHIIAGEFKHRATVAKDYGSLPPVHCFAQKIGQVFMNLLMNASQAIEGSGEVRIVTREVVKGRRADDRWVTVDIADTGVGIPEENLNRIFDPFFTTKPVGQGTGLGLSIVYDIVKGHKGSITVDSSPGKGTTFHVALPVAHSGNPVTSTAVSRGEVR